jgi:hypothetical protein
MDVDLKTISVLLGIASSVVALAFKLLPRSSDRLKRDLELLKLARDAKANHLPLQRHVDAQIIDSYVCVRLGAKYELGTRSTYVAFGVMLCGAVMGIVGTAVAYGAQLFLLIDEATFGKVLGSFVGCGAVAGVIGGLSMAREELQRERRELEEVQRRMIEEDKKLLRASSTDT